MSIKSYANNFILTGSNDKVPDIALPDKALSRASLNFKFFKLWFNYYTKLLFCLFTIINRPILCYIRKPKTRYLIYNSESFHCPELFVLSSAISNEQ